MREVRIGLTIGKGFLDYDTLDLDTDRAERLRALVAMLRQLVHSTASGLSRSNRADRVVVISSSAAWRSRRGPAAKSAAACE